MFSPIKWIKPRLKSLCVAFGAADMTLVVLSVLCWYIVYDSAFQAQDLQRLFDSQRHRDPVIEGTETESSYADSSNYEDEDTPIIKKFRDDRSTDELRLERTIRACGYAITNGHIDESLRSTNFAGSAALIGAAMGGFFVLGALLMSLNSLSHATARRVICKVAIFGEGISSFFLFMGVALLATSDGLCRTEYFYESFQPVLTLFIFTLTFICTYKTYELTTIAFYLGTQTTITRKEGQEIATLRKSLGGNANSQNPDIKRPQHLKPQGLGNTTRNTDGQEHRHNNQPHRQHNQNEHNQARQKRDVRTASSTVNLDTSNQLSQRRHFRQIPMGAPSNHEGISAVERARRKEIEAAGGNNKRLTRGELTHGGGDRQDSGGGAEGSHRKSHKPASNNHHQHHHPLHPTKHGGKANQAALDNFSKSIRMDSAPDATTNTEEHQKQLLSQAVFEFSEVGKETEHMK